MEKREVSTVNFKLPKTLKEVVKKFIHLDTHMNESDFYRAAAREKVEREAPRLLDELFEAGTNTREALEEAREK